METSFFIAKIIALIYLVIGIGLVANPKYYHKMFDKLINNSSMLFFSGILALVAGYLLVSYHNIWEGGWIVVITVFGWLSLIKGAFILMFPNSMKKFSKGLFKTSDAFLVDGLIIIILGLIFGYFGFVSGVL